MPESELSGVSSAIDSPSIHETPQGLAAEAIAPQAQSFDIASPIEVQACLGGIEYPASRHDLLECAQHKFAPQRILATIQQLPDLTYRGVIDVTRELGRLSSSRAPDVPSLPSPALVLAQLRGISFPATKAQILDLAERRHAPPEVMEVLQQIADQVYTRIVQINKQLRRPR